MSIDQATLAARLRQARDDARLTQEEAAEGLKLPRTAIVQMESGNRAVSSLDVRLAKMYRRDIGDFFDIHMPAAEAEPFLVLHRLSAELEHDPDVKREVKGAIDFCHDGAELEEIFNLPGEMVHRSTTPRFQNDHGRRASRPANSGTGTTLVAGDGPIADMSDLLNLVGVWASGVRLPDSMSGLFLADPRFGLVILVNYEHSRAKALRARIRPRPPRPRPPGRHLRA